MNKLIGNHGSGSVHAVYRVRSGTDMKRLADKVIAAVLMLTVSFFAQAIILG